MQHDNPKAMANAIINIALGKDLPIRDPKDYDSRNNLVSDYTKDRSVLNLLEAQEDHKSVELTGHDIEAKAR